MRSEGDRRRGTERAEEGNNLGVWSRKESEAAEQTAPEQICLTILGKWAKWCREHYY